MTIINKGGLIALFAYLTMAAGGTGKPCITTSLPAIKSIFSISASPDRKDILLYGSREEADGEILTGSLFHLYLGDKDPKTSPLQAPEASNPPQPVWQPDSHTAYFTTDKGIYSLDLPSGVMHLVFEGPSEGLAISADGLLLAFWRVGKGSDTLVVYDAKNKVEARTWRIADRFEGDKSGWDLAFGHDGHTLYARTYDQTGATPLKGFNINTGAVAMLHPNSYAAAEADNAVFFIGVSGTARSLLKIGGTRSLSTLVAKNFDYDSLSRGGSLRWLVAQNHRTKAVVIIDGKTDAMREIGKHESVATLSDGTLLLIKGNEVTIDGPLCEDRGRRVALDKSEGLVKDKLSLAMRQHRNVGPTSLPTKTLESIPDLNHP